MKLATSSVIALLACGAVAFPSVAVDLLKSSHAPYEKRQTKNPGFNATAQYVSTSGEHAFVPPGLHDQRGPCPGLNALANHGYLPHNGVATMGQFIEATDAAFGMAVDLGTFLAVYSSIFNGDLQGFSIGFASKALPLVGGLLKRPPQGLGGSHNNFENDASPMRGDLFLYGNSYETQVTQFEQFYNMQAGVPDDQVNFDLDIITAFRKARFNHSIATNPYFFNGFFSGAIASAAAYTFIYRFMANKSEEFPEGRLDRETLKTFYSIRGEPGAFLYTPGWERFPESWYKRAIGDEYSIPFFIEDASAQIKPNQEFIAVGGNAGKVNTFSALNPSNFTGGLINGENLFEGNNFECFFFELLVQSAPSLLEGIVVDLTSALTKLSKATSAALANITCEKLEIMQYNQSLATYPGLVDDYDNYKGMD